MNHPATEVLRFVLDGEVVELADVDPTRTVLQFLREDLGRCGTKEGCAEGDCGACTVVVAGPGEDGRLEARAVNACIHFLPLLDGKELLTVESLSAGNGELHPVQRAMIDCHGSQCGFCTPGFVMSLFALYKNDPAPDRVAIDDALAGNLCRCTGYRPIVAAARDMYALAPGQAGDWLHSPGRADRADGDEKRRVARLRSIAHDDTLALARDGRRFFAPRSAAALAGLMAEHPDATLTAGGTDVGLWVTKELREFDALIYTGHVEELRTIETDDEAIRVGAAVTLSELLPELNRHFPTLEELWLRFASPPIRNAATLGGNVANGSPIGDSMPALLALDATLVLQSATGLRELPLKDFYLGYRETALRPGEFVARIDIPRLAPGDRLQSYKVSKRFDQDISAVCGAFRLRVVDGRIDDARVAFGGMAAVPKRAPACERALTGAAFTADSLAAAADALDEDFEPISDMRASDEYRRRVAKNLLTRCYRETAASDEGRAVSRVYGYGRRRRA